MDLDLSLAVNISLALTPVGLSAFNPNNIAIYTDEQPAVAYASGYGIHFGATSIGNDFGTGSKTYAQAQRLAAQTPNFRAGKGYIVVIPMTSPGGALETVQAAHDRMKQLVQYCGIITNVTLSGPQLTAMAVSVQATNHRFIYATPAAADILVTTGKLWQLMNTGDTHTRALSYIGSGSQDDANNFAAAYASRAMSVDFSGSRTVNSIHLKFLNLVDPDAGMNPTYYTQAQAAGVDVYASMGGLPRVLSSGKNGGFFDSLYNLSWLYGSLQVAGVNALAGTTTKFAQTEEGVDALNSAYAQVLEQAVNNGYCAPGTWTNPDTFGRQADFLRNIQERGWYMYSNPVASQSPADRAARAAPLLQIALKESGAIHSSNVLVNINA